ncbi:unnamed protein product [Rotaria socialis]|uniref:Uncharacterized protein n=1 Tax=Rotaria socialis TaxID=392032 RepID=A0A818FW36_9BILA|nr:unnamed protein product [Rotaria socialis]CAF3480234.1 unnamed protein product [Rotaria socialis]CAF4519187.1 unnamed protein product [Rotaria socialis]CAF4552133.1 unnamed protein product [Rotaria socialis]
MANRQQPTSITLRRCVCVEAMTVPKNRIEGFYDMYRRVEAVDKLGTDGLLIRLQNTQDDSCTATRQLREIILAKDQEIDALREDRVLPLVAKCVEFYGTNVIVHQLKNIYPQNLTIQKFRGWTDCSAYAYQNNNGQWLQVDIDRIINENATISAVWDTLIYIRRRRSDAVHGPITADDIPSLNDSVQYFQRYQTAYTANYGQAVQVLANALQTTPPRLLAVPGQYDLANLLF